MAALGPVWDVIEPLIVSHDLELVDIEQAGSVLRVLVDREGGIDLDTLSMISGVISTALDEADPLPGQYTLEVSSPGVERPLRTPEHFRRFVGTLVALKLTPAAGDSRRLQGVIDDADDESVEVGGSRISYGDIESAHTVFEWGGKQKPGKSGSRTKTKTKKASA